METYLLWSQWIRCAVFTAEEPVWINIDETAVPRLIPHRRGHVWPSSNVQAEPDIPCERIGRHDSHGHLTLVACLCSRGEMQGLMPQYILPKDDRLTRLERARFAALPSPLQWVRGTRGWVDDRSLQYILTDLRGIMRRLCPRSPLVVIMDSAAQHLTEAVLRHAARLSVTIVIVPARCTWLLQPLDTHVFAAFKSRCHALQLEARAQAGPRGVLAPGQWIGLLCEATLSVLVRRDWTAAMQVNGTTGNLGKLRDAVGSLLGPRLPLPLRPPTQEELGMLVCRRPGAATALMLAAAARRVDAGRAALADDTEPWDAPPLPPPAESPSFGSATIAAPISARTRSRTRSLEDVADDRLLNAHVVAAHEHDHSMFLGDIADVVEAGSAASASSMTPAMPHVSVEPARRDRVVPRATPWPPRPPRRRPPAESETRPPSARASPGA